MQKNQSYNADYLQQRYEQLCMTLVKTLVNGLDLQKLTWDAYEAAKKAYDSARRDLACTAGCICKCIG